ncbi:hypothetical protein CYMTET_14964, partial [Cymbomonas tetramitiformis]
DEEDAAALGASEAGVLPEMVSFEEWGQQREGRPDQAGRARPLETGKRKRGPEVPGLGEPIAEAASCPGAAKHARGQDEMGNRKRVVDKQSAGGGSVSSSGGVNVKQIAFDAIKGHLKTSLRSHGKEDYKRVAQLATHMLSERLLEHNADWTASPSRYTDLLSGDSEMITQIVRSAMQEINSASKLRNS